MSYTRTPSPRTTQVRTYDLSMDVNSLLCSELHRFFGHVPDLLEGPDSRFGFFNGLGATSTSFRDIGMR